MNRRMESQKDSISLKPIGFIQSDFQEKFGTPRQGLLVPHSEGFIELLPEWRGKGMLSGLEQFSHVWLLTYFHKNENQNIPGKIRPPRLNGEKVGVFASRSPHRPNAIGLTLASVKKVDQDTLYVRGIDLIAGTPVFDIKPYVKQADLPEKTRGGWTDHADTTAFPCSWNEDAIDDVDDLHQHGRLEDPARFRALVAEMLALDPRPQAYRGRTRETFAVWVSGLNVIFRFEDGMFEVVHVQENEAPGFRDPSQRISGGDPARY